MSEPEAHVQTISPLRRIVVVVGTIAAAIAAWAWIPDPLLARATVVASVYLLLALTEVVPPFVPTLVLFVLAPALLGPLDARFVLPATLGWAADPILALFAGGLVLGVAARRHGVDARVASTVVRLARSQQRRLLALVLLGTAVLSMWISNIAAAAMMLTALRGTLGKLEEHAPFRRPILLAVAIGANLGGMATPIGTGPNGIAIAAAASRTPITFLGWMTFALPLVLGMLVIAYGLLAVGYRVSGRMAFAPPAVASWSRSATGVVVLFAAAVLAWVSEPLHGIGAPLIALGVAAVFFGSGLLGAKDLGKLDWSTLGLVAGGVSLGKLLEQTGLFTRLVGGVDWAALPRPVWLGGLVVASALLSAVMSNTATAAMLVPLAMTVDPAPSTAVIVAIAASFGMPFTISTPPNAMAYGEGGLGARDLLVVGGALMLVGCAVVTLTGRAALAWPGIP
jgi:solute carrier family 13 (sodium-dependent dicarboxylate transporter), member 2/3/5